MPDLLLIFPPQWSAFQPPLSLPALAGWLRRENFDVGVADANIAFYDWLFSDECKTIIQRQLDRSDIPAGERETFVTILDALPDFRQSLDDLRSESAVTENDEDFLLGHQRAVRSLETWLCLVSHVSPDFLVSPYTFQLKTAGYNETDLDRAVESPSPVLSGFVDKFCTTVLARDSSCIGLSCIGQEQLYFTLLFAARLKRMRKAPILVGGTILHRIYERGKLPASWFERYFDVIVKNEGERPCEALLRNLKSGRAMTDGVPGIVYLQDGTMISSPSPAALKPREVPTPDFDGMPLRSYLSPALTLPILSARGCYWGKCEFCHHGMVYGEKYAAYDVSQLLETIRDLSARYGATHFSFNDEALPPKIAREIGLRFPAHDTTGWTFSALYKFEKFYNKTDFANLYRVGVRSLYVGMESASERVLDLMRKPNTQDVVVRNLRDALEAGIWTHCFLFFGFPGETQQDAQDTYDFIFANQDIITSVGCGTFSLEHNAPISAHPEDFGLTLDADTDDDLSVYYNYSIKRGIDNVDATRWTERFNRDLYKVPKYLSVAWIPRDHLLLMLTRLRPDELINSSIAHLGQGFGATDLDVSQIFSPLSRTDAADAIVIIDRMSGRVFRLKNRAAKLFSELHRRRSSISQIKNQYPNMYNALLPRSPDIAELAVPVM